MAYSPKYVPIDEVPVRQVPDDYDDEEKEDALQFAESSLELDVNDGNQITDTQMTDDVEFAITAAIKQKATCELVKGTEDPNDSRLGDLADDGSNKTDYADSFCDRYDEIVEKINQADLLDADTVVDPYVYSTSDPS